MKVRVMGSWRNINNLHFKNLGQWLKGDLVYEKRNGVWMLAQSEQRIVTFQIRVGYFHAPQLWYGFFKEGSPDPGTVNPTSFDGWVLRDFNSPVDVPLRFQFGLYNSPLLTNLTHVVIGDLPKIPFSSSVFTNDSVARHYFTDGVTNVHNYLKSKLNQTIPITLYMNL